MLERSFEGELRGSQIRSNPRDLLGGRRTEIAELLEIREDNPVPRGQGRYSALLQVADKGVLRRHRLLVWILDGRRALPVRGRPFPAFEPDAAPLDLEDQDAVGGIHQDEVCFAVTGAPVSDRLPRYALDDRPVVRQGFQGLPDP